MKKITLNLILALGLLAIAGCQESSPAVIEKNPAPVPDNIKNVLMPLKTARQSITRLDKLCEDSLGYQLPIRAYTIRAEELFAAMGMPDTLANSALCKYKHIRVYLGFQEKKGFKLFLVPVEGANISGTDSSKWVGGRDLMLDSNGTAIRHVPGKATLPTDEFVLDLNAPCPNTCAADSSLIPH
jgi:hypothetical protein